MDFSLWNERIILSYNIQMVLRIDGNAWSLWHIATFLSSVEFELVWISTSDFFYSSGKVLDNLTKIWGISTRNILKQYAKLRNLEYCLLPFSFICFTLSKKRYSYTGVSHTNKAVECSIRNFILTWSKKRFKIIWNAC